MLPANMIIHISVPEVMRVPVWSGAPSKQWLKERKEWNDELIQSGVDLPVDLSPKPSHVWVWSHHGGMTGVDVSLDPQGENYIEDWHLHYGLCTAVDWAMERMCK